MPEEATSEIGNDIPTCGGKGKPTVPPDGAGTGKWECIDNEWTWKETV